MTQAGGTSGRMVATRRFSSRMRLLGRSVDVDMTEG